MACYDPVNTSYQGGQSYRLISASGTNATSIKTTSGNVYSLMVSNLSASDRFVKLYDKAVAPVVGTDTPKFTFPLGTGSKTSQELFWHDWGKYFQNGIAIAITGLLADSDTTSVSAGDVVINMVYA